jgi:hypothetical protein
VAIRKDSDTRARSNNPGCLQAPDASLSFGLTNSTKSQRRSPGRHPNISYSTGAPRQGPIKV